MIIRKRILECEMKFVKIEFSNQFAECCVKGANYNLPGCRPLRQATKNMSKCLRRAELWTGKRRMVRFIFGNILGGVWILYDEFLTGIFQCSKTDSVMLIQLIQNCITTKSDKMVSTRPVFEKPFIIPFYTITVANPPPRWLVNWTILHELAVFQLAQFRLS